VWLCFCLSSAALFVCPVVAACHIAAKIEIIAAVAAAAAAASSETF